MINRATLVIDLTKAVNSHFDQLRDQVPIFFEGQPRHTHNLDQYVEIKHFGPFLTEDNDRDLHLDYQLHLDCFVAQQNMYGIIELVDKFLHIALTPILVPEWEMCLNAIRWRILPKGQINIERNLQATIIEVDFSVDLG